MADTLGMIAAFAKYHRTKAAYFEAARELRYHIEQLKEEATAKGYGAEIVDHVLSMSFGLKYQDKELIEKGDYEPEPGV